MLILLLLCLTQMSSFHHISQSTSIKSNIKSISINSPFKNNVNEEDFLIDIKMESSLESKLIFQIDLFIGLDKQDKQSFKVMFDTGSTMLIVANKNCKVCSSKIKKFDETISKTALSTKENIGFNYGIGSASGVLYKDYVSIGSLQPVYLPFLLCDYIDLEEIDGIIGSLPDENDNDVNILNLYKKNGLIKKNMISKYLISDTVAVLGIGEYPEALNKKMDNINKCSINKPAVYWECTSLFLSKRKGDNEKKYVLKEKMIFDTGSNYNFVSKSVFEMIVSVMEFDKLVSKGICQYITKVFNSVVCYKSVFYNSIDELNLGLFLNEAGSTKNILSFKLNELFIPSLDTFTFVFKGRLGNDNNKNIIGMATLRNFITVFNNEDSTVEFANLDDVSSINKTGFITKPVIVNDKSREELIEMQLKPDQVLSKNELERIEILLKTMKISVGDEKFINMLKYIPLYHKAIENHEKFIGSKFENQMYLNLLEIHQTVYKYWSK